MIDAYSKEWLAITAELDKIEKTAIGNLKRGIKESNDADLSATWFSRGQLYTLEQIRKLPLKEEKE